MSTRLWQRFSEQHPKEKWFFDRFSAMMKLASKLDKMGLPDLADKVTRLSQIDPDDQWENEYWDRLEVPRPQEVLPPQNTLSEPETAKMLCPDCGLPMLLRTGKYGKFYGCSGFPNCKSTHGAHPDGRPLGRPGTNDEKRARIKAHTFFDTLWRGPEAHMSRRKAYRWMQKELGLTKEQAHIGNFGVDDCNKLIQKVKEYQAKQAAMTPEDRETEKSRDTVAKLMRKLYVGKGSPMSREQAYAFMAEKLKIPIEDAHVSSLTLQQARKITGHLATLNQSLHSADTVGKNVRIAMPPYGYHRTDPSRVEDITSEGFFGDISPDYFEEHFGTFYEDLSPEGQEKVDQALIGIKNRVGRKWDQAVNTLINAWYDEYPNDRLVWVSGDPLDDTFGESAIEVDLAGMPEFLNDYSYGGAHRYTLQPGEDRIPPSRFRHISPEELDERNDPNWWWDRSRMDDTAKLAEHLDALGSYDLSDRLDAMMVRMAAKKSGKFVEYLKKSGIPDEIIEYVMSPGRRIPPKLQKWLAYKLRDENTLIIQKMAEGKLPPESLHDSLANMNKEVSEIRDWATEMLQTKGFDIFKYKTFYDAVDASDKWHEELVERMEEEGDPGLYKYPNYNAVDLGNGFRMVQINPVDPEQDLVNEGNLMGHCVGSYVEEVKNGASEIWSLRDEKGHPHTTIELVQPSEEYFPYQVGDFYDDVENYLSDSIESEEDTHYYAEQLYEEEMRSWKQRAPKRVEQIQGKENKPPIEKYRPYIYKWLTDNEKKKKLDIDQNNLLLVTPSEKLVEEIIEHPESVVWLLKYVDESFVPSIAEYLIQPQIRSELPPNAISIIFTHMKDLPEIEEFGQELMQRMQSGKEEWDPSIVGTIMRRYGPNNQQFVEQMTRSQDPKIRGEAYTQALHKNVMGDQGPVKFYATPEGLQYAENILRKETHYEPIKNILSMFELAGNPEGLLPHQVTMLLPLIVAKLENQIRNSDLGLLQNREANFNLPYVQSKVVELAAKNSPHLVPKMMPLISGKLQSQLGHGNPLINALSLLKAHEPEAYVQSLSSMTDMLKSKLGNKFSGVMERNYDYNLDIATDIDAIKSGADVTPYKKHPVRKYVSPFDQGLPRTEFPDATPEEEAILNISQPGY